MADQIADPLKGVTKADFQAHRHHPVSILLRRFLADYQESLRREAWDHLMGKRPKGVLDQSYLEEITGRVKACAEMADLPFEALEEFYAIQGPNEESGSNQTMEGQ